MPAECLCADPKPVLEVFELFGEIFDACFGVAKFGSIRRGGRLQLRFQIDDLLFQWRVVIFLITKRLRLRVGQKAQIFFLALRAYSDALH